MVIDTDVTAAWSDTTSRLRPLFELAAGKVQRLARTWATEDGAPVFTVAGRYTQRGWTEWTQGFQYGCALLTFDGLVGGGLAPDAPPAAELLEIGSERTLTLMAPHLTHAGVHDHGFNTMSTYGNLLRLALEERLPSATAASGATPDATYTYRLAIQVSGAVQATRWTALGEGLGFVHSFNGPHSLFIDTIRSMRVLAAAHQLGHVLMGESDRRISLLQRLLAHAETTARYNVYFGEGRDIYDVPGRVAHESIFNITDGAYRCPSSQQGYSAFSTWTRGLAWAVLGYAELAELMDQLSDEAVEACAVPGMESRGQARSRLLAVAQTCADFYIANTASDGIPYWDTGAPGLAELGQWQDRPAEPANHAEPVDSSAAAIAAQGLLRLGRAAASEDDRRRYTAAGLTASRTVMQAPYLSTAEDHDGLLLHAIYHRPNGWDHRPSETLVPHGESCMWGDYHLLELAVLMQRLASGGDLQWNAPRASAADAADAPGSRSR